MSDEKAAEILKPYRARIDELDQKIVTLLAERFDVVREVGEIKKIHHLSPVQPARMDEVLNRVADMAAARGLSPDLVRAIYNMMIDHAHTLEFDIVREDDDEQ